jgi:hypothetical protein
VQVGVGGGRRKGAGGNEEQKHAGIILHISSLLSANSTAKLTGGNDGDTVIDEIPCPPCILNQFCMLNILNEADVQYAQLLRPVIFRV